MYETCGVILSVPAGSLLAEARKAESGPTVSNMSDLILTCTVSERISGLTSVPSAQWTTVSDTVSENVTGNATTAVTTLSFAPSLLTSHAGQYTCIGSLNSPAADDGIITTSADPISVNVSCEFTQLLICCVSLLYPPSPLLPTPSPSTVPVPDVSLSVPSGPLYEGTTHTLICTVTLPSSVDTDVNVTIDWTSHIILTDSRVTILPPSSLRFPFISTLTIRLLSRTDVGQYSCTATADSASQYIRQSPQGHSQIETLNIAGKTIVFKQYDYLLLFCSLSSACSKCQYLILW